jgi:hypothetical protein
MLIVIYIYSRANTTHIIIKDNYKPKINQKNICNHLLNKIFQIIKIVKNIYKKNKI